MQQSGQLQLYGSRHDTIAIAYTFSVAGTHAGPFSITGAITFAGTGAFTG